ncbi:MAG: hypothetical protein JO190_01230 [Candidatus Eremiobacteraeota bacterium]|nr:hypothetical protein [Candidatus Eremiobacteraeota bacterium]MBV8499453.1 hypothetical protein [Candidatus Eremiobacteraeota bacterium]
MKNLCLFLLAAVTSACGAGFTAAPAAHAGSALRAHVQKTALVYVSDHSNNLVDVFDIRGNLRYSITDGVKAPAGLFVDAQHDLWVANPGANNVLVFRRGSTTPSAALHDPNQPNDVAVCHHRTAFVADSLNLGGIAVFPPGHKNPTRRLVAQQSGQSGLEFYVACDLGGNIFATGVIGASPFPATVGWRHARESGYYLLQPTAQSESGIKATAARTLLIPTYTAPSQPALVEFTEAGTPTGRAIHTGGTDLWGDIALDAREEVVFGVDTPNDSVVAREFPGGELVRTYTNGNLIQPAGVAVDPGD